MSALWKKGILPTFKGSGGLTGIIYYCITIIANIVAAIVFYKNIVVFLEISKPFLSLFSKY